jgi:hypothetical protein
MTGPARGERRPLSCHRCFVAAELPDGEHVLRAHLRRRRSEAGQCVDRVGPEPLARIAPSHPVSRNERQRHAAG